MRMISTFITFFMGVSPIGCETQPKHFVTYSNPNISNEKKYHQWLIDEGECLEKSHSTTLPTPDRCEMWSGMAKAMCLGGNEANLRDALGVRRKIFEGCLAKKGYKKEVIQIKE